MASRKNLAPEAAMYKRKLNQVTIFEDPAMFGGGAEPGERMGKTRETNSVVGLREKVR